MSISTYVQLYVILIVFQTIFTIKVTYFSRVILNLKVSQLVKEFSAIYGTKDFTGSRPEVHEAFKHGGNFISRHVYRKRIYCFVALGTNSDYAPIRP
jgi:hypothetical protein